MRSWVQRGRKTTNAARIGSMAFQLVFTDRYRQIESQFLRRHPEVRRQYDKTLELLEANPLHPSLRLHRLKGRLATLHSVSINLSYRITLELLVEDERVIPLNVGSHDAVY